METRDSLPERGRTLGVGRVVPSEVGEAALATMPSVALFTCSTCPAAKIVVATASDARLAIVLDDALMIEKSEEVAVVAAADSDTGQKLHTCLFSSQYRSKSNRRKPAARRFDKHALEVSSSNLKLAKQAAERDTPGLVTKLMGTCIPRSLCDCVLELVSQTRHLLSEPGFSRMEELPERLLWQEEQRRPLPLDYSLRTLQEMARSRVEQSASL